MLMKTEFHSVEFFRKIRDLQAAALSEKTPAEIIAFFSNTPAICSSGSHWQAGSNCFEEAAVKQGDAPRTN